MKTALGISVGVLSGSLFVNSWRLGLNWGLVATFAAIALFFLSIVIHRSKL